MRQINVFNNVSLDGYFVDAHGDMSWAHKSDPEWAEYASSNAQGANGALLFGRKTYEMMASFWPTPKAIKDLPEMAEGMNRLQKIVFSRTLKSADWNNTTLLSKDLAVEVRKLKQGSGEPIVIMGSGTIISQLTKERLIDQYTIVIVPLVLGAGRTMFEGLDGKLAFKRTKDRTFKNGNVVATYEPA